MVVGRERESAVSISPPSSTSRRGRKPEDEKRLKNSLLTVGDPLCVRVRRERQVRHLALHVHGGAALVDLDEALGAAVWDGSGNPVFFFWYV